LSAISRFSIEEVIRHLAADRASDASQDWNDGFDCALREVTAGLGFLIVDDEWTQVYDSNPALCRRQHSSADRQPFVVARPRSDGDTWEVDCPYCYTVHLHGLGFGHRVADCGIGGYLLVADAPAAIG
jgi:hypothetical protein